MTRSKTKKSAPTAEVSKGGESETQPCATCQKDVVDACIGCDSCERWVHLTWSSYLVGFLPVLASAQGWESRKRKEPQYTYDAPFLLRTSTIISLFYT